MDWSADGYILSARKHGETSAIIDVFTREKGRHPGLVRGGIGRRMRPVLQPGNHVTVEWRGRLEDQLGYYLDLTECAATGALENLTHVSPRSGRAVCTKAAAPYGDKMLTLPGFMRGEAQATPKDIWDGLRLTGYFLETRVQWEINRTLPEARTTMIDRLVADGYASRPQ